MGERMAVIPGLGAGDYLGGKSIEYDDYAHHMRQQKEQEEILRKQLEIAKQQAYNQMASMYPGSISPYTGNPYDLLTPAALPTHNHGVKASSGKVWILSDAGKEAFNNLGEKASQVLRTHKSLISDPTNPYIFDKFISQMEELEKVLRNAATEYGKLGKPSF